MAIFKNKIDLDNIQSVILLETTQTYSNKSKWGLSFNNSLNPNPIIMEDSVPTGSIYTFSITYNNGKQEILKVKAGTSLADLLLQKTVTTTTKTLTNFELQKNQLPNGTYIVGKDIPAGTYDFILKFGNGIFNLYNSNDDTTLGNLISFFHIGSTYDYEHNQLLNIRCIDGNRIDIIGNCVLEITKSKKVEIEF